MTNTGYFSVFPYSKVHCGQCFNGEYIVIGLVLRVLLVQSKKGKKMKTPCSGMEAITAGPFHCVFGTLLFGPLPAVLGDRVGLGLASSAPLLRP